MIGVRKMLDYVFTKEELKILDDILPEFTRREKLEIEEEIEKEVSIIFFYLSSLV
jgi:sodium bicarbonate transporter 10